MDETPLYFCMPSKRTYDLKGVKTGRCKTTGHDKLRFSVVLTVLGNGEKLKPIVIFKNLKKAPKGEFPKTIVVSVADKGFMTTQKMDEYRKEVWQKRVLASIFNQKSVLVMDSHPSHKHRNVSKKGPFSKKCYGSYNIEKGPASLRVKMVAKCMKEVLGIEADLSEPVEPTGITDDEDDEDENDECNNEAEVLET
ncbi:pogo transposable element with KRAB domain-like protein [Dinothrombium tinctorium]|uniref:Pogo transposable element with KRAB domain-like protein n=1 Tax=Dinothrombium tinctorium TaxID=1965070 RepID=A0A443RJJ4_9ACAR|nr:pogo transposable element with KRAB domain-like protein [Dinothrombium tinctorium]